MPLPDPRLRIPPTKTSMPITQAQQWQQNVNTPKNPMTSGPLNPTAQPQQQQQQQPQMKSGGSVKCMKKGGVVSAEAKKVGRNVARANNQKSSTKPSKVPSAPVVKGGSVIGKTKRGYGAARRG